MRPYEGDSVRSTVQTNANRRRRAVAAITALATLATVTACGSDDGTTSGGGGNSSGDVAQASDNCPGDPLRLTGIASLSGPLAINGEGLEVAIDIAVRAVNDECELGRPLEITVCDDRSDPNGSTECGRTAASDGSLALIASVGVFDNGAEAAGLPSVYTVGAGVFDHTSPESYPYASIVTQVLGAITTSDAAGAESAMLVTFESPATTFIAEQAEALATDLGMGWESLFFPQDTTDFAPIAAQIVEADPDSLGFGVTQVEPFLQALLAEGWDMDDRPTLSTSVLLPPRVLESLGEDAEGLYLMSSVVPPTATDNPGIADMAEAYETYGVDYGAASVTSVQGWTAVHSLTDALSALSPEEIEGLDSDALVEAATTQGPVEAPEGAPFDLSQHAFPEDPALSTFRLFSREAMPTRYEDGQLVPAAGFIDVETPFEFED